MLNTPVVGNAGKFKLTMPTLSVDLLQVAANVFAGINCSNNASRDNDATNLFMLMDKLYHLKVICCDDGYELSGI